MDLIPQAPFGFHVAGLSLWQTLADDTVAELRGCWSEHGLLVFRRQALSETELVKFSSKFGNAEVIVREDWASQSTPHVIQISNMKDYYGNAIGGLGAGELGWHTDQSYVVAPATGSILYMVEMPSPAPATHWANLQLAYAALDRAQRQRFDKLEVIYDYLARQSTYDDEPDMSAQLRRKTPVVSHPLVCVHPLTGRKSLYLDPTTAVGIVGWSQANASALLEELAAFATQAEFVHSHAWQIGDVVMWDNGFLMHRRDAFEASGNRLLKRTTLQLDPAVHMVPTGVQIDTP